MTNQELRQEIVDAMKSVQCFENDDKGRDAIKVEADNVRDLIEKYMNGQPGRNGGE